MAPIFSLHMNFGMDLVSNLKMIILYDVLGGQHKVLEERCVSPIWAPVWTSPKNLSSGAAGQFGQDKTEW